MAKSRGRRGNMVKWGKMGELEYRISDVTGWEHCYWCYFLPIDQKRQQQNAYGSTSTALAMEHLDGKMYVFYLGFRCLPKKVLRFQCRTYVMALRSRFFGSVFICHVQCLWVDRVYELLKTPSSPHPRYWGKTGIWPC